MTINCNQLIAVGLVLYCVHAYILGQQSLHYICMCVCLYQIMLMHTHTYYLSLIHQLNWRTGNKVGIIIIACQRDVVSAFRYFTFSAFDNISKPLTANVHPCSMNSKYYY